MDIGIISVRYAKALLKYAVEKGETKAVYEAMLTLRNAFERVTSSRETLDNPVIDDAKKFEILNLAAGGKSCGCLCRFFQLVLKNHRVTMVQFMANSYIDAYRKKNHLIHSRLTVPVPVADSILENLKSLVKEKTDNEVEFIVDVDPSIIGGFIMEYDAYSFDASVRGRLQSIRKGLLENDSFMTSNQR